jgi:hypothetical protein
MTASVWTALSAFTCFFNQTLALHRPKNGAATTRKAETTKAKRILTSPLSPKELEGPLQGRSAQRPLVFGPSVMRPRLLTIPPQNHPRHPTFRSAIRLSRYAPSHLRVMVPLPLIQTRLRHAHPVSGRETPDPASIRNLLSFNPPLITLQDGAVIQKRRGIGIVSIATHVPVRAANQPWRE